MEACGLTNCSAYKSLTVDTSALSNEERYIAQLTAEETHPRILAMFHEGGLIPAKTRAPNDDVSAFYWAKVVGLDDDRERIFLETRGQNLNKKWFQVSAECMIGNIHK